MKNTIKQIFHSGKFVTGFVIFLAILLTIIIYPLVVAKDPLASETETFSNRVPIFRFRTP